MSTLQARLTIAHAYGFPSWYSAAPSPYDPPDEARPFSLEVLLFIGERRES